MGMSDYKAGDKVRAEVEVTIPADATGEQVQAWLDFCFGARGGLAMDNPLADTDAEADWVRF